MQFCQILLCAPIVITFCQRINKFIWFGNIVFPLACIMGRKRIPSPKMGDRFTLKSPGLTEVGRDLWRWSYPALCSKQGHPTALQQCSVLSTWVLNFIKDGDLALFTRLCVEEGWGISFDKLRGDRQRKVWQTLGAPLKAVAHGRLSSLCRPGLSACHIYPTVSPGW